MWPSGLGRWTLDYTIGVVVYQRWEFEYQREENNKLSDEKYNSCTVFNHERKRTKGQTTIYKTYT